MWFVFNALTVLNVSYLSKNDKFHEKLYSSTTDGSIYTSADNDHITDDNINQVVVLPHKKDLIV